MAGFSFRAKQILKMLLQRVILPISYHFWRGVYAFRKPDRIILADAHHDAMPYSLSVLHKELLKKGYPVTIHIRNYGKLSTFHSALVAMGFMRLYAQAKCVFICDNFLPVVSCKKRKATKVIQLWHACGVMKKMGYDTQEDIPAYYRGNVYRNYDLVTVSSPACVPALCSGMRLTPDIVKPIGVSRTDRFFDEEWVNARRAAFYSQYPQAKGKTVILWAPTFRGNAADPYLVGGEAIQSLEEQLGENYFVLRKVHPHLEDKLPGFSCPIPTEELLPVADLMITDYSSIVYDFLFFKKPFVLFSPDYDRYEVARGTYIPWDSITPCTSIEASTLHSAVVSALEDKDGAWIEACFKKYLSACDGQSTQRILEFAGL